MRERVFRLTLAGLVGCLAFFLVLAWLASYCTPDACTQSARNVSHYLSAVLAVPAVRLILDLL